MDHGEWGRCICSSKDGEVQCSGAATKDDSLCDFCRVVREGN